jgi:hypothetical protein
MAAPVFDVRMPQPERFDGDHEKFRAWIASVRRYCELMRMLDDRQCILFMSCLFTGHALTWFTNLEARNEVPNTVQEFLGLMTATFGRPQETMSKLMNLLAGAKQSGSVRDYIDRFEKVRIAYPDAVPDAILMGLFLNGLKKSICKEILMRNPANLAEAQRMANDVSYGEWLGTTMGQSPSWTAEVPMELDVLRGRSQRFPPAGEQTREWARRERRCFNCEGFGHIARHCPTVKGGQRGPGGPARGVRPNEHHQ